MSGITPKKRKMKRIGERNTKSDSKPTKRKIKRSIEKKTVSYAYQIVLTNHNKFVKKFKQLKDRNKLIDIYHKELSDNKVIFPLKYNVLTELVEADYNLLFIKEIKDIENIEIESNRIFIDNNGKKWKIVKSEPYQFEETFRLYGFDGRNDRKNTDEIKNFLISKDADNREFGIIGNKIVIFNEDDFDMIITKCPEDARRFGKFLYSYINNPKLFFYRGEYQGGDKPEIIDIIQMHTNWDRTKINRIKKSQICKK